MKTFNFLWVLFCASSCNLAGKIILKRAGILENKVTVEKISNIKKTVVFVKMHHVGTSDFYKDVKVKIDSLHLEGYIFLYEGVTLNIELDSLKMDTVKRKYRKLFGFGLSNKGYLDTTDHSIMGNRLGGLEELINQQIVYYSDWCFSVVENKSRLHRFSKSLFCSLDLVVLKMGCVNLVTTLEEVAKKSFS